MESETTERLLWEKLQQKDLEKTKELVDTLFLEIVNLLMYEDSSDGQDVSTSIKFLLANTGMYTNISYVFNPL